MKLYSWNVNGLRAAEKKGFLEWLHDSKGDIVAVQETKASQDQLSTALLKPNNYTSYWHSAVKKGYSGVGTYSLWEPASVYRNLGEERFDQEGRMLISDFGSIVFFNGYYPNGGRGPEWVAHKLAFYRRLLSTALELVNQGRSVILCGDFNTAYSEIDLARPKENSKTSGFLPEERIGLGEFFQAGFIDTYRALYPNRVQYTWWDMKSGARARNIGWRIDYFMISPDLVDKITAAEIHDNIPGSDHCPISLTLNL